MNATDAKCVCSISLSKSRLFSQASYLAKHKTGHCELTLMGTAVFLHLCLPLAADKTAPCEPVWRHIIRSTKERGGYFGQSFYWKFWQQAHCMCSTFVSSPTTLYTGGLRSYKNTEWHVHTLLGLCTELGVWWFNYPGPGLLLLINWA